MAGRHQIGAAGDKFVPASTHQLHPALGKCKSGSTEGIPATGSGSAAVELVVWRSQPCPAHLSSHSQPASSVQTVQHTERREETKEKSASGQEGPESEGKWKFNQWELSDIWLAVPAPVIFTITSVELHVLLTISRYSWALVFREIVWNISWWTGGQYQWAVREMLGVM